MLYYILVDLHWRIKMKSTIDKINKFRDDRDWRKFHNEKDLAISISIEASELLELFQWKESDRKSVV